jgi:ABC-type branched-subunit amino acid transport system ATPase component/ABC-type branched-subunit amino acid transport system permease subunit
LEMRSMPKKSKFTVPTIVVFAFIALCLPILFGNDSYVLTQMITVVSYAIAALGITVALGFGGQIALSQAAFFGLGAYGLGILTSLHGWGFWSSFLFAIVVPVVAGLLLGAICLRLVTHYLALATIGFGIIIYLVLFNWKEVTGGADGIMNIPRPVLPFANDIMLTGALGLSGDVWYYWFGLFFLGISCVIVYKLRKSRLGRALLAVREDELAAQTNGIDMFKAKLLAFSVSAGLGGLGGIIFAAGYQYISPTLFVFDQSVVFFAMAIIGGSSSIVGTLIGTVFLGLLPELLRDFQAVYKMIYGGLIMVCMAVLPGGIWGLVTKYYGKMHSQNTVGEKVAIKFPKGGTLAFLEKRKASPVDPAFLETAATSEWKNQRIVLDVTGLKKHFGGVKAVDGVDFKVQEGEIHVLIGPNGSGKTTVINVLSGLYTATEGKVRFKGQDITNNKPHQIVQYGVSRTFQNIRLFPELTVIENVMIGHHSRTKANLASIVFGTKKSVAEEVLTRQKAEEALRFVGFTKYQELAKNLSYGQQRMVEIARSLVQEPELLLLDEPAAGMNPDETQELVKLLKRINQLGLTLLLIEHDMDLVTEVANNVTVLDFGKKISEGSIEEVINDPEVIRAYLGEEFVHA